MFNQKIKQLRLKNGLKINEVASFLGVDSSLISRFEGGTRHPTNVQVFRLEELFKTKPNELVTQAVAEDIIKKIVEYPDVEELFNMVSEAVTGYQKLLNKKEEQKLPAILQKIVFEIDTIKHKINGLKPLNNSQLNRLNDYFFTNYTFESNKIEGNTLTLQETSLVIKEGLTIGGKSVKEHLEAINHAEAVNFINEIATKNEIINERTIKDLHYLILKSIDTSNAGKYRSIEVRISGSKHLPPAHYEVAFKMQELITYFQQHSNRLHPVILAADMHQILVGIHPFIDGNGRTSRLLMNLILLQNGYYIANIKGSLASRLKYYKALEKAHVKGSLTDFRVLVAKTVKQSLNQFYNLLEK